MKLSGPLVVKNNQYITTKAQILSQK